VGTAPREVPTVEDLRRVGLAAGLDVLDVASAEPFVEVRATLEARKAEGLHGGMAFTYRRPERSTDPSRSLPDARALVVGARSYLLAPPGIDETEPPADATAAGPRGRIARYAWEDHYGQLTAALAAVGEVLRADGWRTRVLVDDNALVDRAAAHRAGLAWWGKNANLLLPGLGSWYVLGSVLTDAPLVPTDARVADLCGTCTRCLDGCPTGAITAPGVVDARRCLSWLLQADGAFPREHRVALGDRIYGCDECQEVCPPNRRAPVRAPSGDERTAAPLLDLLHDDDAVVLAWAHRWYIPRREVRYVRRNALVVLGNVGDPADPRVVEALERHLRHPDELLRAHAVWAARRLGREDLLAGLTDAADPMVAAELSVATSAR
jgi:epoxyqueuosine reductase